MAFYFMGGEDGGGGGSLVVMVIEAVLFVLCTAYMTLSHSGYL